MLETMEYCSASWNHLHEKLPTIIHALKMPGFHKIEMEVLQEYLSVICLLATGGLREEVLSFKFRQNRVNRFHDVGVEICHFLRASGLRT